MVAMTTWSPWLLLVMLPWRTRSEFLKSQGDVMVLKGHEAEIHWSAYSEDDLNPPCSWKYARNTSTPEKTFLVWEDGQRFEYEDRPPWQFTSTQEPCKGGIRKIAIMDDAGVYRTERKTGYNLNSEDTRTFVKVYDGASLKYSVTVNESVYLYDFDSTINQKMTPLHTDKPVSIKVDFLSKNFPSTKLSITRDSQKILCDHATETCKGVLSLSAGSSSDIVVVLETGILGAEHVTITQPIEYVEAVDNTDKNSAIAFGILFFLLLFLVIAAIVILIIVNRKDRKTTKVDVEVPEKAEVKKMSMVNRTKRHAQSAASDFISAFKHKKASKQYIPINYLNDYLDQSETEARELERTAGDYDSRYMTHEKWFNELLDGTKFCLDDALRKCKAVRDEMEYILDDMNSKKQREVGLSETENRMFSSLKHMLEQAKAYEDHLTWLNGDLERCSKMTEENRARIEDVKAKITRLVRASQMKEENANEELNDYDAVEVKGDITSAEAEETDTLNKPKPETEQDQAVKKLADIRDLHKRVLEQRTLIETFDFMKVDLQRKEEYVKAQKSRIITIEDGIHSINQTFSSIRKGWEHEKNTESSSPTGSSPNPTPAHAAAMPAGTSTSPAPPPEVIDTSTQQPQPKRSSTLKKISSIGKSKRKSTEGGGDK